VYFQIIGQTADAFIVSPQRIAEVPGWIIADTQGAGHLRMGTVGTYDDLRVNVLNPVPVGDFDAADAGRGRVGGRTGDVAGRR